MLLRGGKICKYGNRPLVEVSNNQENCDDYLQIPSISRIVEEQIKTSLEHFANEDATVLGEAYHNRASNERSLLFLAHCLTRASNFESAYHLLKTVGNPTTGASGLKMAKSRYLFAYCAFTLNRLQESENTLRDMGVMDQVQLHHSFKDTPSLPYAHSLLARILCETNRVESAQFHWAQSIKHNPMLWTSMRSYCDAGGRQIRKILKSSLNAKSICTDGLLEWLLRLAEVQEHLSQFNCMDALKLLNALSPEYSQLPLSLELRARVFFENGEYKRSCQVFEEIRRLYPRRLQSMEIYSTALWQLHDQKKLSALASEMAEIGRNEPETWCIAGNCFSLEKQHETAIECLERAIRLNHRFGYAYSLLGHELIDMNDLGRAEQAFRKAIVYSPNDYRAWYGLGLVNYKEEKMHLARMNIQRSVKINPTNTVLLCQLAVIEQALQHNDTAMECLERALKHQPNNVPCRFHRARLLFDTGHYERAKVELEELKVLSPDEAHVFFLLGRVNRKLGATHKALVNFSWATEIDPRGEQNQSALTTDNGPYDDEPID